MRILYDSKQPQYKTPFGTVTPEDVCTINIQVPSTVAATGVECIVTHENGDHAFNVALTYKMKKGPYETYQGRFTIAEPGLYFYYFFIHKRDGGFRLFKEGNNTNMESGDMWQLTCAPTDFTVPDWARGGLIYQVFPDRFHKVGKPDLTGKLEPYVIHENWYEEVHWQPTPEGIVLNNDFYGGNFKGITEKMDYIASLGTNILYLNPISMSFSSHRYDTGDYKKPDPMLGTEADFQALCAAAHIRGIKVILDGVYSHTGSDSRYFNKNGTFDDVGAYNSTESPYFSWYDFHPWPDQYKCWWNFETLPTVNKMHPDFLDYIIRDADSVVAHWLRLGADGFRLDVADELPDEFIKMLKDRIRAIKPDALLIGEVWEDASRKEAYGKRRRYFVDGELDSIMNYPFRTAIIDFMRERDSGRGLQETVMTIMENYPPQVIQCNMNLLGTHDTPRILTALVDDFDGPREEQAKRTLSRQRQYQAYDRLLMASFIQYMLPGSPSIYYGDEAGMEGYRDPFNRRPYPWGREDQHLLNHYRRMGQLRRNNPALRLGDIRFFQAEDQRVGFIRSWEGRKLIVYINRSTDPWDIDPGTVIFGHNLQTIAPDRVTIAPMGFCVVEE